MRLLGGFEVVFDGRSPQLGGLRQRAALAVLLLRSNHVVPVDQLIDDLWAGHPPASADTTLRGYLSHLRRALAGIPVAIETKKPGYVAALDPWALDTVRFDHWAEEGSAALERGDVRAAAERLRQALALWRGAALADFTYEAFAQPAIRALEERRLAVLERRMEADLALGGTAELVAELEAVVAEHPLHEGFRAQLMRALHRSGRRSDALRTYHTGRAQLVEELGVEPGPALKRLEQAILAEDPDPHDVPIVSPRRRSNIPVPLTTFVGRDIEMQEVLRLIEQHRVVTLTGTGGSGKTRLALEATRTLERSSFSHGWFVELASVVDPRLVPETVADALGLLVPPDRDVLDSLLAAVAGTDACLVLDNCEHVLESVRQVATALLQGAPGLRLLLTSREPLGIPGEVAWRVPGLTLPADGDGVDEGLACDAVRLFAERAVAADPRFELTADVAREVVGVCRRLDGIPLAIELAAARLQVLAVRDLAALLDDRFRLLTTDSPAVVPRHRTLRAVVDWSYDLLRREEQALLDGLAVFAGPFDLGHAQTLARALDDGIDVVSALGRLVATSLVARVDGPGEGARYRLLETIRAYGLERLVESGRAEQVRSQHAAMVAASLEERVRAIYGNDPAAALEWFARAEDDVRAALRWTLEEKRPGEAFRLAASAWPFWDARFRIEEGRRSLEEVLQLEGAQPELRLRVLVGAAALAFWDDDFDAALDICDRSIPLSEAVASTETQARLRITRAEVLRERGDAEEAAREAAAALGVSDAGGDHLASIEALRVLAMLAADAGSYGEAERLAAESLYRAVRVGYGDRVAAAHGTLGSLAYARGDLDRAATLFERCLAEFRALKNDWSTGRALMKLAGVALQRGDVERAAELARESLGVHEEIGSSEGVIEALLVLSDVALARRNFAEAHRQATSAIDRARQRGVVPQLARSLVSGGTVAFARGDFSASSDLLSEAVALEDATAPRGPTPGVRLLLGRALSRHHDPAGVTLCLQALAQAQQAADADTTAQAYLALADVTASTGELDASVRYLKAARDTGLLERALPHVVGLDLEAFVERLRDGLGAERFAALWSTDAEVVDLREAAVRSRRANA